MTGLACTPPAFELHQISGSCLHLLRGKTTAGLRYGNPPTPILTFFGATVSSTDSNLPNHRGGTLHRCRPRAFHLWRENPARNCYCDKANECVSCVTLCQTLTFRDRVQPVGPHRNNVERCLAVAAEGAEERGSRQDSKVLCCRQEQVLELLVRY